MKAVVLDRVGQDDCPVAAKADEQLTQRPQALLSLLDRDHIKALDDLLHAGQGMEIALRRIRLKFSPIYESGTPNSRRFQVAISRFRSVFLGMSRPSCRRRRVSSSRIAAGGVSVIEATGRT